MKLPYFLSFVLLLFLLCSCNMYKNNAVNVDAVKKSPLVVPPCLSEKEATRSS